LFGNQYFKVNSFSQNIIDHETWIFNLTEANLAGPDVPPRWFKEYSAREDLELPGITPADLHKLVFRMVHDDKMFKRFYG